MHNLTLIPNWTIWVSIIGFAVHNVEEASGIEQWAGRHLSPVVARYYRTAPFVLAVCLLWMLYALAAVLAMATDNAIASLLLVLGFAAIFANAVLHVVALLLFRRPSPGVWSAFVLMLPLGIWAGYSAISQGVFTARQGWLILLAGALLQAPIAAFALLIGNVFVVRENSRRNERAVKR